MSNKNARQLYKAGRELSKNTSKPYGGNGGVSISASHDYGNMRGYGLTCLNKTARKSGIKEYANMYVGRRGRLTKVKSAYDYKEDKI